MNEKAEFKDIEEALKIAHAEKVVQEEGDK